MKARWNLAVPDVRRGAFLALITTATLVLLAACSLTGPIRHPVVPHHGGYGSTSGPTPSGTPSTAALAPPKVRIPLTCSQLAATTQVSATLGATVAPIQEFPDPDLSDYSAIQDGALNCTWSSPITGGYTTASYDVMVIPDATQSWATFVADYDEGTITYPVIDFGPNAYGSCDTDSDEPSPSITCTLHFLVGTDWLDISAQRYEPTPLPTAAQVQAKFVPLMQVAYNAVKGAITVEPAWTDPAATAMHLPPELGAVDQATFETTVGRVFASENSQPTFDQGGAIVAEYLATGFRSDTGGGVGEGDTVTPATNYGMNIDILPSGSWAYAQMKSAASGRPGFSVITGLGTKAFLYTGTLPQGYTKDTSLVGIVGEHLYSIDVSGPGTAGTPDPLALAKTAAAYVVTELTP